MYKFLCGCTFSFPLGINPGVELLGHFVALNLIKLPDCFPKCVAPFFILICNV